MHKLSRGFILRAFLFLVLSTILTFTFTSCEEDVVDKKPVITGFTPNKGLPGTAVIITGSNFNPDVSKNAVTFFGIPATVTEATKTSLTVTVPEGVNTGKIEVTVNGTTVVSSADFIVPPVVNSFSPSGAIAGSSIVITGTGFSSTPGNNQVTFNNGKAATVTQASSTSLTVVAPSDGSTGKIVVTVGGESSTSGADFSFHPAIQSFIPAKGSVNGLVTITGSGFSLPAQGNLVSFNGTTAEVISGTANTLVVKVPQLATTGQINVSTGGNSASGNSFEVVIEAVRAYGAGYGSGFSIAVDGVGNTYITGSFQGTQTFGNTSLVATGSEDIFVAKYNANSELQWAKRAGGTGVARGSGIVVDGAGNSYITGYFTETPTFGSLTATTGASFEAYIAKLNASGDFIWVKSFHTVGTTGYEVSSEIILDAQQNLVIAGQFNDKITIGTTTLTSVGNHDMFVAKFNKDTGNAIWVKQFGGTESNGSSALSFNQDGDLFVGGSFFGTIVLNTETYNAGTILNSFIMKLNASGDIVWSKEIDGIDWNNVYGITIDMQNNCIVGGYFTGSATLQGTVLNATGNEDIFIAKYSGNNGSLMWAKKAGGSDYDQCRAIATDASNNYYATGYFTNTAVFDTKQVASSPDNREIFVVKYNTDGVIQWIKTAGGAETDSGEGVTVSSTGIVCTTGFYRDFSATFGTTVLPNGGADDVFQWKIWPAE